MKNKGFSLTELLIVIGIIVLVTAAAVPMFSFITGSRSIENAQNIVAASIARARLDAIKHQETRGVVFYRDTGTDRISIAVVEMKSRSEFSPPPDIDVIEVVPGTDVVAIPSGVEVAFRHQTDNGYLYRIAPVADLRGAVLFNSKGHYAAQAYGVGAGTELARRLGVTSHTTNYDDAPSDSTVRHFYSQPAFLFADRARVNDAANHVQYLNDNGAIVLVDRYSGTLTRSE